MEGWLHRPVARDVARHVGDGGAGDVVLRKTTLEIGAGTLNQLPYEPAGPACDIVEPFAALYEGSPHLHRICHIYADIAAVPPDHRYYECHRPVLDRCRAYLGC